MLKIIITLVALTASIKDRETLADDFADRLLRRAMELSSSFDDSASFVVHCDLAVQFKRFGKDKDAIIQWEVAGKLADETDDQHLKQLIWAMIIGYMTQAGDLDGVEAAFKKITDTKMQSVAHGQIAGAYCDISKFEEAVIAAEKIDKFSQLRFNIMERIARRSAAAGNFNVSFRAARGMDPLGGEYASRKMRWMSELCQILWKAGEVDLAKETVKNVKVFSIIVEDDPVTLALLKLNEAALNNESLSEKLDEALDKVVAEGGEKLEENYRAIADTLVSYDRREIIKLLLSKPDNARFNNVLTRELATKFATVGATEEVEEHVRLINDKLDVAAIYLRLASIENEQGKPEQSKVHFEKASEIVVGTPVSGRDDESSFWPVFEDLLVTSIHLGYYDRSMELLNSIEDKNKAFVYTITMLDAIVPK